MSDKLKTKEVTVGERKFNIASITIDQWLAYFDTTDEKWTGKDNIRKRVLPVVSASFNNAILGDGEWFNDGGEPKFPPQSANGAESKYWTPARVSANLDFGEVTSVYQQIMDMSGFKTEVKQADAGEEKAAPKPATSVVM